MADNDSQPLSSVNGFIDEGKRRGVYTGSQDSLIASWKLFLSTILPAVNVPPESLTVGEAREQLSRLFQSYGAKGGVKTSSVRTYETKVRRLLTEFSRYHGGTDAQWYAWKQQSERKSEQASLAASSRGKKNHRKDEVRPETVAPASQLAEDPKMMTHVLPLPGGKRRAELRLPSDLRLSDFPALEKTFNAIISLEKARVEVIISAEDAPLEEGAGAPS